MTEGAIWEGDAPAEPESPNDLDILGSAGASPSRRAEDVSPLIRYPEANASGSPMTNSRFYSSNSRRRT